MSVARIARRYAQSLIEMAVEQQKLDRILEDVKSFQEAAQVRDFYLLLKSPIIHHSKKQQIVEMLFGSKYDDLTMAFLRILINKGREGYLPEIAKEFIAEYKKKKHITTVRITTPAPLSEAMLRKIHDRLAAGPLSGQQIEFETKVDESLIGGYVIEYDGKIYDSSVKSKLDALKKEFEDNLYISQIIAR